MTKRTIITITLITALIVGIGAYGTISGKNDNTDQFGHKVRASVQGYDKAERKRAQLQAQAPSTTSAPIMTSAPIQVQAQARDIVADCERYIVTNADFPGYKSYACEGIHEDDERLNYAYRTMWTKLLNCANEWIAYDTRCNYGNETQWLKAYELSELGQLDI